MAQEDCWRNWIIRQWVNKALSHCRIQTGRSEGGTEAEPGLLTGLVSHNASKRHILCQRLGLEQLLLWRMELRGVDRDIVLRQQRDCGLTLYCLSAWIRVAR